jgi:hypothetical protein
VHVITEPSLSLSLSLSGLLVLYQFKREREHDPFFLAASVMLLPQTGVWAEEKRKRGTKKFSSKKKRKQDII